MVKVCPKWKEMANLINKTAKSERKVILNYGFQYKTAFIILILVDFL